MTRIPGLKTIRRHGRQLAARVRPSALVLGYHRVTEDGDDPFGLAIARARFEEQMEVLARRGRAVPLGSVVDALATGRLAEGGVAVTFDDGYVDNLAVARPVLERFGLPFSIFVTTGGLGRRFWWHRFADVVEARAESGETLEIELGGRRIAAGARGDGRVGGDGHTEAYHALAALAPAERERILDALAPSRAAGDSEDRAMTEAELRRLAADDGIELGAHGVTHAALDDLDEPAAAAEIRQSGTVLARITGRPVRHFSYPHGRTSAAVRAMVRDAGYDAACSSEPSPVFRGRDPFDLPRVWVPDLDGDGFERWLSGWTGG